MSLIAIASGANAKIARDFIGKAIHHESSGSVPLACAKPHLRLLSTKGSAQVQTRTPPQQQLTSSTFTLRRMNNIQTQNPSTDVASPEFQQVVNNTSVELFNEDCLTGMERLGSQSVDVVVTSPPYNLDIAYAKYDDDKPLEEYLDWTLRWVKAVRRVLKTEGSLFLNLGGCPSAPMLPHFVVTWITTENLFQLQNTIHWIKSISLQRDGEWISVGHFKPLNSKRYVNDVHEYVFHLTPTGNTPVDRLAVGVPYADKSNISRWGHTQGKDKRCRGNSWFIPYKTIQNREGQRPHPATFPKQLAENCIKLHGQRSDLVVCDPFNGIGHTALAAVECGVGKFIGFDIDPEYHATAVHRLGEFLSDN
jgi:site-specific DNA-methyltransferase (adenine-specific)